MRRSTNRSTVVTLMSANPVTVRNIVRASHRGTLAGPLATRPIGREPLITFVTFGELAKWAEIRNWGQRRREEPTSWLSRIAVLPGDEAVAATWQRRTHRSTTRISCRTPAWSR